MHVFGQRFAKRDGVGRKSAAPVPLNCKPLPNRLAAMRYAGNAHSVSIGSLKGGDDRDTLADLGQSQQRVRRATLQQDIGPHVGEAAGCVEQPADGIAGVQQQQRKGGKGADIDDARATEIEGWGGDRQGVDRWQNPALEAGIALINSDAHVSFAAFEQGRLRRTEGFGEMHMHVGTALGISRQEPREHALDRVRRRGDLEHSPVSAPQDLRAFADRVEIGQYTAAVGEEFLAFAGQDEAPPHVVEQPQAQLLLKIADLSRQRGLSNAQAQRSFRYAAQLGDCNERSQAPRIHPLIVCRTGM